MPAVKFHGTAFQNLGIEPELDSDACQLLRQREAELKVRFPVAVRELFEHRHAERLLMGVEDVVVPLRSLGDDYTSARPIMKIFEDRDGLYAVFIQFDGKDDPVVRLAAEGNDWKEDENGLPVDIIGSFSFVVRQQTERVLAHEREIVQFARQQEARSKRRSPWSRLWSSIKRLMGW